jgi:hypothetical protein
MRQLRLGTESPSNFSSGTPSVPSTLIVVETQDGTLEFVDPASQNDFMRSSKSWLR